jgi:hypothetical protein
MLFQNTVEVNAVKDQRSAARDAYEVRPKVFLESATLHTQILRRLLAVVATLIHLPHP